MRFTFPPYMRKTVNGKRKTGFEAVNGKRVSKRSKAMKRVVIIALMIFIGCCQVPISKAMAASSPQMVPFQMMPDSTGHATTLVPPH